MEYRKWCFSCDRLNFQKEITVLVLPNFGDEVTFLSSLKVLKQIRSVYFLTL